jgi:hypothetical protein
MYISTTHQLHSQTPREMGFSSHSLFIELGRIRLVQKTWILPKSCYLKK